MLTPKRKVTGTLPFSIVLSSTLVKFMLTKSDIEFKNDVCATGFISFVTIFLIS
ncbi:uncharacterized protein METZ01_LOCUS342012 [marine metagenome]|uniref:Uncharacterized protein n=1 Tax=marine metagenome TaxID=408172 RepID=A0A382QWB5_9ZZZZ